MHQAMVLVLATHPHVWFLLMSAKISPRLVSSCGTLTNARPVTAFRADIGVKSVKPNLNSSR